MASNDRTSTPATASAEIAAFERRQADHARFGGLTFDDFRKMASDGTLSPHEKVGFPDEIREGAAEAIVADVLAKLPSISQAAGIVVDIGPGCSDVAAVFRSRCLDAGHRLYLVDSPEMLAHHPDHDLTVKVAARFPDCPELLTELAGRVNAILVYSVLQYAFFDASPFAFVDAAVKLLAPGGRMLIADLPNASMRKRFLASESGAAFHRAYTGSPEPPVIQFNSLDEGEIDDAALFGIVSRARAAGFHAWIVPQAEGLPMANRREDIVIERP